MKIPTPKGAGMEVGLLKKAKVSQERLWMSRWDGASNGASPCEPRRQLRGVLEWWS